MIKDLINNYLSSYTVLYDTVENINNRLQDYNLSADETICIIPRLNGNTRINLRNQEVFNVIVFFLKLGDSLYDGEKLDELQDNIKTTSIDKFINDIQIGSDYTITGNILTNRIVNDYNKYMYGYGVSINLIENKHQLCG